MLTSNPNGTLKMVYKEILTAWVQGGVKKIRVIESSSYVESILIIFHPISSNLQKYKMENSVK